MYNIHNTAVVPYLIAEIVTDDREKQDILCEKAEKFYANNENFRNQFHKSQDERQFLLMFMEHWNKSKKYAK